MGPSEGVSSHRQGTSPGPTPSLSQCLGLCQTASPDGPEAGFSGEELEAGSPRKGVSLGRGTGKAGPEIGVRQPGFRSRSAIALLRGLGSVPSPV